MGKALVVLLSFFAFAQMTSASYDEPAGNPKFSYNCVLYARSIVKDLPHGLNTIWDKIKIINSKVPQTGAVAVIKTGRKAGHVAYVRIVEKEWGHIFIEEANWKSGKITSRWIRIDDKSIAGYYIEPRKQIATTQTLALHWWGFFDAIIVKGMSGPLEFQFIRDMTHKQGRPLGFTTVIPLYQ